MKTAMIVAEQCEDLGQALGWESATDPETVARADGIVFVLSDYYTRGCWEMKKWLDHHGDALRGKLCGLVVYCAIGGGGDLATRSILSQLLPLECQISLCAIAGADGLLRIGGTGRTLTPAQYKQAWLQKNSCASEKTVV